MASDKILTITKENFEQTVIKSEKPVLVDFWAAWCGPCRTVAPYMEQLAEDYTGKALIGKVNVDEESDLAAKFRIMSIPTVMMFKGGQAVGKIIGVRSKDEFSDLIQKNL